MADEVAEARIAELEAEIARLRGSQNTPDVAEGMQSLNLTVERARAGNEEVLAAAASTWSSFCCAATVSSASSYCVAQEMAVADPEVAQAFVILHKRAVEVMGEDGVVQALIEQANNHEVLRVTPSN